MRDRNMSLRGTVPVSTNWSSLCSGPGSKELHLLASRITHRKSCSQSKDGCSMQAISRARAGCFVAQQMKGRFVIICFHRYWSALDFEGHGQRRGSNGEGDAGPSVARCRPRFSSGAYVPDARGAALLRRRAHGPRNGNLCGRRSRPGGGKPPCTRAVRAQCGCLRSRSAACGDGRRARDSGRGRRGRVFCRKSKCGGRSDRGWSGRLAGRGARHCGFAAVFLIHGRRGRRPLFTSHVRQRRRYRRLSEKIRVGRAGCLRSL